MFFFLTCFTLYNRLQFPPLHQNWFKCILFNGWVIVHCVYVPQLSYPFVCRGTSRLLSCLDPCKQYSWDHVQHCACASQSAGIVSGCVRCAYVSSTQKAVAITAASWLCPWGREESDTTERLHFHFSLSCIGEGNGNPLQCSCLENPRDRGAWWAAVYGVAQGWTRLKRLSSSRYILYIIKIIYIKC